MAKLLAAANIDFTGNWLVCNATAENDSESANTALTTSYQNSTAFTPGAITVDGIAFKVASRAAGTPTNTLTGRIGIAGADVAGTVTTMNVSDIDPCSSTALTANEGGWYYLRFNVAGTPTPVLLLAATAYTVGFKLSATSTAVNLYSASGTNWTRSLATTTTAAPAAGDRLCIVGDRISAGVSNNYTVTMNNTATTSFGSVSTQALTINKGGTLISGTAAATAYYLKVKGPVRVFSGGTLTIGTSGTPIPSNSSFTLFNDSTAATDSGLEIANGATFTAHGKVITTIHTLLTADEAAAQTVIGSIGSTAGWSASDVLAFSSTTQTASQGEKKTILTVDSGTAVTLTAGLTNAHSGTSPTQAEIGNLTRNIKFLGASASLVGYHYYAATATVSVKYAEYTAMGNFNTNKTGVVIATTTGSCTIQYCSLYDFTASSSIGIDIVGSTSNNFTVSDNVIYNMNSTGLRLAATSGTSYTINNNMILHTQSGGGSGAMSLADIGGTITNNRCSGSHSGSNITISATDAIGTFSGNVAHSGSSSGVTISGAIPSGTLSTITSWRNAGSGGTGISISSPTECTIDSLVAFGNSSSGITISSGAGRVEINNSTFNAGVTLTQPVGILFNGSGNINVNSCTFGSTTTHATADINISGASTTYSNFHNCTLSSGTPVANQTNLSSSSYLGFQKYGGVENSNRTYRKYGTYYVNNTEGDVTFCLDMAPNNASFKLETLPFKVATADSTPVTVTVKVKEDVTYNGNRARLVQKKNYAAGVTADVVLDTATAASDGAYETLSGATSSPSEDCVFDLVVDCDGTAGRLYVDTFTNTPKNDTKGFVYWQNGTPLVVGDNSAGGSSGGSYVFIGS